MKRKLTLTHKKILAGLGLVVGIALHVGGYVAAGHSGALFRLSILMNWGIIPAMFCGEYLHRAIFKPEKLRKEALEKNDERNQLVRGKAAYVACIVLQVILVALAIGFYIFDNIAAAYIVLGAMLVQVFCYRIAKKVIEKKI